MKVEIAFSGESMLRRKVRYPLHRVKPGPETQIVCTSAMPMVIVYHWHQGRPVIHTTPLCLCNQLLLPCRERAYLGGLVAERVEGKGWRWNEGVVEVTETALESLMIVIKDNKSLRGAKLGFRRRDQRKAACLSVQLYGYQPEEKLGVELDLLGFVHTMWDRFLPAVALPQTNAADHRVAGEEGAEEIPY